MMHAVVVVVEAAWYNWCVQRGVIGACRHDSLAAPTFLISLPALRRWYTDGRFDVSYSIASARWVVDW